MADALAKRWSCVYAARTGARARALFATRDDAKEFAERQARAVIPEDKAFVWEDSDGWSMLSTGLGEYLVTSLFDESPPR